MGGQGAYRAVVAGESAARQTACVRSSSSGATLAPRRSSSPSPLAVRSFAYVLLAATAAVGCGDAAAPSSMDGGATGGIDMDGGVDGGTGGVGGMPTDGGMDGGPACGVTALCPNCPDEDAECDTDDDCPIGEVCLETGCDDLERCFVIGGGGCIDDLDCGDPAYACALEIGRCLRVEPGCASSSDCVPGFACENDTCVDRRVPCVVAGDCPHGYTCRAVAPDQQFCLRVTHACDDDIDCQALGVPCGDVEGDGPMECMASFDPSDPAPVSCDNSQCASMSSPVCEVTASGTRAVCGTFGLCASEQDCADGFECRDLWGDARRECVLPEGSCVDSKDCALREVCASPRSGEAPRCVKGAAM